MTTMRQTGLHWFKHDLRLDDNGAIRQLASQVNSLHCVYVVDPRWFKASHFQSAHMGQHRFAFLISSLRALDEALQALGNGLHLVFGDPVEEVSRLAQKINASWISTNAHSGVYERQQWQRIKQHFPSINFIEGTGHSLFDASQLPFELVNLPATFTPFRKKVETVLVDSPTQSVEFLPPTTANVLPRWTSNLPAPRSSSGFATGGHVSAKAQLNYYLFETDLIQNYKQTRNGLDGWDFSSKLSAWLANGAISAKQVVAGIKRYESERGSNESTYWLYFELLWREYFYWYGMLHQHRLFKVDGVKQKKPLTSFWPQRFAKWCAGNTPYPIVNACMNQLNATGFMSNRGRQLVASCLVHELGIDWRYGAAYFEQQLIDFDVASNYGNWQYLAGVGADPRGHRQFDLDKQTQIYDPNGEFIAKWDGQVAAVPLDDVDPSDWPIFRH